MLRLSQFVWTLRTTRYKSFLTIFLLLTQQIEARLVVIKGDYFSP